MGILNAVADLFGDPASGTRRLTSLGRRLRPGSRRWLAAVAANPTAALLPVQATYYMGMLGSTPARMFMSSGGGGASGAGAGALDGMKDSLLENVSKLVDGKAATVMTGVGGQLSKWGAGIQAGIQAQMANAMHAGGLSVPHGWHTGVPDVESRCPVAADQQRRLTEHDDRPAHQPVLAGADGCTGRTRHERHGFEGRRQGDATFACRRLIPLPHNVLTLKTPTIRRKICLHVL